MPALQHPAGADELRDGEPTHVGRLRLSLPRWIRILLFGLYFSMLAALGLALLTIDPSIHDPAVQSFEEVAAVSGATPELPTVILPYRCIPVDGERPCSRRFRLVYQWWPDDDRPVSIYVPSLLGSVDIRVGGVLVGVNHWSRSATTLGSSIPLLVTVPAPLLRPGPNEIEIHLESPLAVGGFLGPFHVGPDDVLRPRFHEAVLLNHTLPRIADGWAMAMALIVLLIWAARPQDRLHLIAGVLLISYVVGSLPSILIDSAYDEVLRITNASRFISGALLLPFVWHFVGRPPPVPVYVFLALPLVALLGGLLLPLDIMVSVVSLVLMPALALLAAVALLELARAVLRHRSDSAVLLMGAFGLFMLLLLHDVLAQIGVIRGPVMLFSRYGASVLVAVMSGLLLWQIMVMLRLQEGSADRLRVSVAAAEERLRRSFVREQEQTRTAAMQAERVRIMSDLHDGIAGHLVSILSLSELRGARATGEIAQASRRALDDLRIVVASLQDVGQSLNVMMTLFRDRVSQQLRSAGIRLVWQNADVQDLPGLNPTVTLSIFRILQEAVTNAIRHSGSTLLEVEVGSSPDSGFVARIVVRDHGRGGAEGQAGGFGIRSMQRRAANIGARLSLRSTGDGTAVILDLPQRLGAGKGEL